MANANYSTRQMGTGDSKTAPPYGGTLAPRSTQMGAFGVVAIITGATVIALVCSATLVYLFLMLGSGT